MNKLTSSAEESPGVGISSSGRLTTILIGVELGSLRGETPLINPPEVVSLSSLPVSAEENTILSSSNKSKGIKTFLFKPLAMLEYFFSKVLMVKLCLSEVVLFGPKTHAPRALSGVEPPTGLEADALFFFPILAPKEIPREQSLEAKYIFNSDSISGGAPLVL